MSDKEEIEECMKQVDRIWDAIFEMQEEMNEIERKVKEMEWRVVYE